LQGKTLEKATIWGMGWYNRKDKRWF